MINSRSPKEIVIICFFWIITAVMVTFAIVTNIGGKGGETEAKNGSRATQQIQNDEVEGKIARYKSLLSTTPNNVQAMIGLGDLYFNKGLYQQAITLFSKASEIGPASVHVENDLGLLYLNTNNYDKALEHFNTALKIDPKHIDSLLYIGIIHQHKGNTKLARQTYQQILAANPSPQLAEKVNKQLAMLQNTSPQ